MFHTFPPPAPLAPFVASLWVYESDAPAPSERAHIPERALPTGLTDLMISLRSDRDGDLRAFDRRRPAAAECLPAAMLRGAHSAWYDLEVARVRSQVGVRFKAGGAAPFLPLPAHELHNLHVPLHTMWGARAAELHERLLEAPTPAACAGILANALLAQTLQPLAHHPAVAYALQVFRTAPRPQTIACVVEQVGLSHRRFDALFRAEVGLSPKQFCRVRRFTRVIRRAAKGSPVSWASLAIECGYYDQAHLINDFRAFAGMTPSAYLRFRRTLFLDYVVLVNAGTVETSPAAIA